MPSGNELLPPVEKLAALDAATAQLVIRAADKANQLNARYSTYGMVFGFLSFVAGIGAFTYLVHDGHPASAGVVLGADVLAVILTFIKSRL